MEFFDIISPRSEKRIRPQTKSSLVDIKPINVNVLNLLGETTPATKKLDMDKQFTSVEIMQQGTAKVVVQRSGEPSFVMRGNECSMEQQRNYDLHAKDEIDSRMLKYLRRRPKITVHGGKSLNMILADDAVHPLGNPQDPLYRESQDWDVFASHKKAKKMANKIEKAIDQHVGCDICEVVHIKLPVSMLSGGGPKVSTSSELIRMVTPHSSKDAEIDIMPDPDDLERFRHRNVSHESLEQQYAKTKRGLFQPMRAQKSAIDKRRIETY
ncbi:unnamed protein product, partial [marine sediment metagenome]